MYYVVVHRYIVYMYICLDYICTNTCTMYKYMYAAETLTGTLPGGKRRRRTEDDRLAARRGQRSSADLGSIQV